MTKTVLVTGIGGNVGQGILRNIKALNRDIRLVGTNITGISAGNHLCDVFYKIPFAYEPGFITAMQDICRNENVDLIIPSTDLESVYLAQHHDKLPVLATSPYEVNRMFTDKFSTWEFFSAHGIPFAQSVLPSAYNSQFKAIIVKPRQGRGSRGLHFNPADVNTFNDTEYMVQELHEGMEITSAFYVTKKRELHGHLTFERKLENGTTSLCLVTHTYDDRVTPIMRNMIKHLDIKGACNIQSIVTGSGAIVPFEINGRISGTNSIRANFGFRDVEYTIDEYLYHTEPKPVVIKPGASVRILMDVIYPGVTSYNELEQGNLPHYIY